MTSYLVKKHTLSLVCILLELSLSVYPRNMLINSEKINTLTGCSVNVKQKDVMR
jgi:hypothetical protein